MIAYFLIAFSILITTEAIPHQHVNADGPPPSGLSRGNMPNAGAIPPSPRPGDNQNPPPLKPNQQPQPLPAAPASG
ncbi:unnamed protein product [Haemonchus placei]|uniref:Secreted protein n=1 Tax=Haemonchus placei TaxID=6290 RepID=A0A0N4W3Z4_HAEPC|nr:unnamed protein product [Haemonchus placei]